MGQSLSCVSKKQKHKDDIKKTKDKKLVKQAHVTNVVQEVIQPVEANAVAHVSNAVNHVPAQEELDSVQRRQKLVILKPAPQSAKTPTPLLQPSSGKVDPPLDKATFETQSQSNRISSTSVHQPQPVDQVARQIAQSEAKPATWTDLYWALIGSRNLKTDEEQVKALFSWLCSIPLDQRPFLTYSDLEQAVSEGIEFAAEAKARKTKSPSRDSPEVVVNDLVKGKSTYLRAFESLCRYSHIPCCTVKGLAKGVDYAVGMQLADQAIPPNSGDQSPISRIQHAWSAAYIDGKWALFDSMWAAERLAMNANARLSQIAQVGRMEYETDMFYFNADPKIFIYSHFPFDEEWQLLTPPVSLKQFQDSVLLKPAFFTHGLGLFSHQEGKVPVQNKLVVKLSIPPTLIDVLLFTFNLKLEGKDEMFEGVNLSRFGMHEISKPENVVTFSFRFPKAGAYKLTIYARKVGDPLFTDVCEYRVEARGADPDSSVTAKPGSIDIPPFPPTSQSHYGPTEKAIELQLQAVPPDISAVRKCVDGVFEVRFATTEPNTKLPKMTARLKSLLHDTTMLIDCILVRTVDASLPVTGGSAKNGLSGGTSTGSLVPFCIITAYLPSAGEYALEVYGAPADSEEDTSYFLVWQFMIDADCGVCLSTPVRKRLATTNLGPQDQTWSQLGIRTVSHPDPLIHVPTKGIRGLQRARSKNELMKQFVQKAEKVDHDHARQSLSVSHGSDAEKDENADEPIGPLSCDLRIVLEKPAASKLCIVGQLVDISEPTEEDRTTYLLQQLNETDDEDNLPKASERIDYLIRIPKGDHFYKFYVYAAEVDRNPAISLPLVYTYLLEAPQRLMAAEAPYIGVQYGPFPQKLEQQQRTNGK